MATARRTRFRYTPRSVRKKGRLHGRDWRWKFWPPKFPFRESKDPEPPAAQEKNALFENELKEAAENDIQLVVHEWTTLDEKLKKEYCTALAEFQLADKELIREAGEASTAAGQYQDAEKQLLDMPSPALEPRWALFWLFVIAVAEIPLNSMVFQLLGQEPLETYIIAGILAVVIPLSAHFFGRSLKQDVKKLTDKILIAVAPTIVLGLLVVIAFLRGEYLRAMGLLQTLGITLTPMQATTLFLVVNVAIFFVAVVISYEGSHSDTVLYKTRRRRWREAKKLLAKEAGEAEGARRRFDTASKALHQKRQIRHKRFQASTEHARSIKESFDLYVTIYRTANLESRRNAAAPQCFHNPPPTVEMRSSTLELDWTCEEPAAKVAS